MSAGHSKAHLRTGALVRWLLFGVSVALVSACQLLFGDFSVEPDDETVQPGSAGGSVAVGCEESKFRCLGAVLERCSGGEWRPGDTCSSFDHCDAKSGRCNPCKEGEVNCVGATLQTCNPNHDAWVETPCSGTTPLCDSKLARCVACAKDQTACNGAMLMTCNDDRDGWVGKACLNGCRVVDGITDFCVDCTLEGDEQCSSLTTLRTCIGERWVVKSCASCTTVNGTVVCSE